MSPFGRFFSLGCVLVLAITSRALPAITPSVVLKTEQRPGTVRVLTATDRNLYLRAFQAAEQNDWRTAHWLAAQGHDMTARRLIEWRYLSDKNSGATFDEIASFLRANAEWPGRDNLFARAESAITAETPLQSVLRFFQSHAPISAVGKLRLGEAYLGIGNPTNGTALIREAWTTGDFKPEEEYEIIRRHNGLLTADVERARLSRLLFEKNFASARRELPRVSADMQRVAQVRLALATSPAQGLQMLSSLSPSQQADPGLMFDRAKLAITQNQVTAIPALLARSSMQQLTQANQDIVWDVVSAAAHLAIADRYYTTAHSILQYSGLRKGDEYGEAEFLAGWLDLRFIRNPREAHTHFINLAANAQRPVSKARAFYWAGRADEAAGDYGQARNDYASAAQYPQTFYGQLSTSKINPSAPLRIPETMISITPAEVDVYRSQELTRAMHVLADLGLVAYLRIFATYDAETNPNPKHLKLLAADLSSMGFTDVGIRVAKSAAYRGIHFLTYSHPLLSVPFYSGPGNAPETAFVLAIIRQETEFDPAAVSAAGARGLMQLMPSSAKQDAGRGGLPYLPGQLLSNPVYNMRLGMIELADNLARYSGSYLLTAAAYNAGRGNVSKWIRLYGDPRSPVVDPLDWIEEIPFAETRNYVQRVLENTEVYRNRLTGRDEPLHILSDLYRPRAAETRSLPNTGLSTRSEAAPPQSKAGR